VDVRERIIKKLMLDDGRIPFDEWFDVLDLRMQSAVDARLNRLRAGNFGDWKSVGKGVMELRVDKGPGLRVYLGVEGATILVLIAGGDKSSQAKDIKRAQYLWAAWKSD
jgi:putative addiction module killer protein